MYLTGNARNVRGDPLNPMLLYDEETSVSYLRQLSGLPSENFSKSFRKQFDDDPGICTRNVESLSSRLSISGQIQLLGNGNRSLCVVFLGDCRSVNFFPYLFDAWRSACNDIYIRVCQAYLAGMIVRYSIVLGRSCFRYAFEQKMPVIASSKSFLRLISAASISIWEVTALAKS